MADEIKLNGEAVTEEDIKEHLKGLIRTKEITISCGETRQVRQYEPNNYHESAKISIDGLSEFLDSLEVETPVRRRLSALSLGMLTARCTQMYNFMKASIHKQQEIDCVKNVDRRDGESADEGGE